MVFWQCHPRRASCGSNFYHCRDEGCHFRLHLSDWNVAVMARHVVESHLFIIPYKTMAHTTEGDRHDHSQHLLYPEFFGTSLCDNKILHLKDVALTFHPVSPPVQALTFATVDVSLDGGVGGGGRRLFICAHCTAHSERRHVSSSAGAFRQHVQDKHVRVVAAPFYMGEVGRPTADTEEVSSRKTLPSSERDALPHHKQQLQQQSLQRRRRLPTAVD